MLWSIIVCLFLFDHKLSIKKAEMSQVLAVENLVTFFYFYNTYITKKHYLFLFNILEARIQVAD